MDYNKGGDEKMICPKCGYEMGCNRCIYEAKRATESPCCDCIRSSNDLDYYVEAVEK